MQKRTREIEQERAGVKQRSREQREFYDLLYRLKRDGFITGKQTGNKNRWLRTAKGEKKIDILKKYFSETRPRNKYEKENDSEIKIIAFDIPEKYRRKRWWLRGAVKSMGFTMLQKSVWISVMDMETELRRENLIYQDEGIIICSAVKSGEGINGRPVKELVRQWYRMEELNRRYDHWIGLSKSKKTWAERDKFILKMRYLKILADDPQLPFKLLPGDWLGDEANKLYEQKVNI